MSGGRRDPGERTRSSGTGRDSQVGERYEVVVGPVAHGGHCVARHEGRVVFVRHALPGERVVVVVTEGGTGSRFLRADAVEVLEASPDRVEPPCPFAGPGRCGGCDFQHVSLAGQRRLKAAVVTEQLHRLAGLDLAVEVGTVEVEPVPGDDHGLGWRTRMQYAVDASGRAGLRRHRSHDVVPVDRCRIAHPGLPAVLGADWSGAESVEAVVSSAGERLRVVHAGGDRFRDGPERLHERAAGRGFEVSGTGFWQVHPGAADALVAAVLDGVRPQPGERALDLYAGVGLFSAALADAVGPTGRVVAVESDGGAAEDAATNLADPADRGDPGEGGDTGVRVVGQRVDRALRRGVVGDLLASGGAASSGGTADVAVLDPPRAGAKRAVVEALVALRPRAVAYVACDPAALARDVAIFAEHGYRVVSLRGFDLFPMTSHVECVALLEKTDSDRRSRDSR